MKSEKNWQNKLNLLACYQCVLAIAAVFAIFSNLDIYLYKTSGKLLPLMYVIALVIASLPLYLYFYKKYQYLSKSLFKWCIVYILISIISFEYFTEISEIAQHELETRISSVIFLMTMHLIFNQYSLVQKVARLSILIVTITNVFNNILEFTNPSIFGNLNDTGRSAGFYINPNMCGASLIMGMIFCITIIPPKFRLFFVLFIGIGTLLTFSRGSIIGWIIVVILLIKNRIIAGNQLFFLIGFLGIFQWLNIGALLINFIDEMGLTNGNSLGRIMWFRDPSSDDADQDTSRLDIVKSGWNLFFENPILGNGLASTQTWSESISTHNIYLNLMIDHGFLGALIMPLLVYTLIKNACGETKIIGSIFATFILLWGIFSHNILEQRFILILFSLMASMNMQSRLPKLAHVR